MTRAKSMTTKPTIMTTVTRSMRDAAADQIRPPHAIRFSHNSSRAPNEYRRRAGSTLCPAHSDRRWTMRRPLLHAVRRVSCGGERHRPLARCCCGCCCHSYCFCCCPAPYHWQHRGRPPKWRLRARARFRRSKQRPPHSMGYGHPHHPHWRRPLCRTRSPPAASRRIVDGSTTPTRPPSTRASRNSRRWTAPCA